MWLLWFPKICQTSIFGALNLSMKPQDIEVWCFNGDFGLGANWFFEDFISMWSHLTDFGRGNHLFLQNTMWTSTFVPQLSRKTSMSRNTVFIIYVVHFRCKLFFVLFLFCCCCWGFIGREGEGGGNHEYSFLVLK